MNYYEILGVDVDATDAQIKKVYKHLAHRLHPDKNNQNKELEEEFVKIKLAYETLIDEEKRKEYDLHGVVHSREDHVLKKANESLAGMFIQLIDKAPDTSVLDTTDMKSMIEANISNNIKVVENKIALLNKKIAKYQKAKTRSEKSKNKLIQFALRNQIMTTGGELTTEEINLEILNKMNDLLDDFEYDFDKPEPIIGSRYTTIINTHTNW